MPTYEYQCPEGHRFEVAQKMSDAPLSVCAECGAPAQRKISGGAGFLFKGEGFYITDYRSDDYKKKASADAGDSSSKPSEVPKSKSKLPLKSESGSGSGGSGSAAPSSDS